MVECQEKFSELEKLGVHYTSVELGEAEIREDISEEQLDHLSIAIKKTGLELMDDKKRYCVKKQGNSKKKMKFVIHEGERRSSDRLYVHPV